ncbi:Crp/Fnr family transcriptional regulator [Aestuariivirga sp.]|uniref:Crp/Fnr family transcriptional regulator n=1 Tax=Aestuariivirga sp. TaxID=2650926 RepID=UPI003BAA6981
MAIETLPALAPVIKTEADAKAQLQRIGWLAQLPEPFRHNLLGRCRLQKVEGGKRVYGLDDPPGGIYGVASGSVSMSLAPQERGPYFGHLMGPGSWFGLAAAVYKQSRVVGATATRASILLLLPMAEFDALVAENPASWRFFTAMALMNASISMNAADDLLIRDTSRRCIATLLRLAGLRNTAGLTPPLSEVDVTQEELAYLSNLSRNAAGLLLRDLQKRGHIELAYKTIRILDPAALQDLVRNGGEA